MVYLAYVLKGRSDFSQHVETDHAAQVAGARPQISTNATVVRQGQPHHHDLEAPSRLLIWD